MSEDLRERLRAYMRSVEAAACSGESLGIDAELHWAALAGLGSKYLAVGSPDTLGIVGCGEAARAIRECHALLFGPLQVREVHGSERDYRVEEAFACDIVCLPSRQIFEPAWLAEATHLNILDTGERSPGVEEILQSTAITTESPIEGFPLHGSMAQVITGQVSGRVGEELTLLLHNGTLPPTQP